MKPITHPLAIMAINEYVNTCSGTVEGRAAEGWRDRMFLFRQWSEAGCPLYADPTPPPAPALGMRVWYTRPASDGDYRALVSLDITNTSFCGCPWKDIVGGYRVADITHITDFRTGEVLWRRQ